MPQTTTRACSFTYTYQIAGHSPNNNQGMFFHLYVSNSRQGIPIPNKNQGILQVKIRTKVCLNIRTFTKYETGNGPYNVQGIFFLSIIPWISLDPCPDVWNTSLQTYNLRRMRTPSMWSGQAWSLRDHTDRLRTALVKAIHDIPTWSLIYHLIFYFIPTHILTGSEQPIVFCFRVNIL